MPIDEKALDIALKKHLCTEHTPCRVAAAHLIDAYEAAKASEVDIETGAKALWQGSTLWEQCTQQHRDYWRGQAKSIAEAWRLKWK